jgi:hypothetical protein
MSTETEPVIAAPEVSDPEAADPEAAQESRESTTFKVVTWLSVGMAVAALGIFVGRELCSRYKFKRQTPYDFYSHAGEHQIGEFGVGI